MPTRRALLATPLLVLPALAQERFPNRPVRLVYDTRGEIVA